MRINLKRKQCGGKVNYYGKPNLIWQFYERIPNSFEGEWINGKFSLLPFISIPSNQKKIVVHMRKYSLLTWQFHAERIFYPIDDDISLSFAPFDFFSVNKMDKIGIGRGKQVRLMACSSGMLFTDRYKNGDEKKLTFGT